MMSGCESGCIILTPPLEERLMEPSLAQPRFDAHSPYLVQLAKLAEGWLHHHRLQRLLQRLQRHIIVVICKSINARRQAQPLNMVASCLDYRYDSEKGTRSLPCINLTPVHGQAAEASKYPKFKRNHEQAMLLTALLGDFGALLVEGVVGLRAP
jgi:hypothetical protein